MQTQMVSIEQDQWLGKAMDVIRVGGVVAFPTDTVYGIGADPFQPEAVASLYRAKGRPADKAIAVLMGSSGDLPKVAQNIPDWVQRLMEAFWPGALTLILEKQPAIPSIVSGTDTLGVRMPDHPVAVELMGATGPLAVTSANVSGVAAASEAAEVERQLGGKIEMIVDGGVSPGGQPSTVLDCSTYPPKVLREGPISTRQIGLILGSA